MPARAPIAVRVIASSAATGGDYAIADVRLGVGVALDPHVASREDLVLHVISGELLVVLDGIRHALGAGQRLGVPRGVPRALAAPSGARVLCLATPGGLEHLASLTAGAPVTADDRAALLAAAEVRMLPHSLWGPGPPSCAARPRG